MRAAVIVASLLALLLPRPAPAGAADGAPLPSGARVALVSGPVEFLGPESEAWAPAELNLVLQPGDRLRTGQEARAEVQFEGGALFRLGAGSEAELLQVGASPAVRLAAGRAYFRAPREGRGALTVQAGDRTVGAADGAGFRVDLTDDGGTSQVTVTAGRVAVESAGRRVEVDRGERLGAGDPLPASLLARDDFDRWNADRDAALARAVPDSYAPRHLPGLADLDRHGSWIETDDYGYVWRPYVAAGWRPYLHGRWVYRPFYGWVWVAVEPWGWTPYHYGRWVWIDLHGWVWVPGTAFTPVVVAPPFVASTVIITRPPIVVRPPVVVHPPVVVRPPVVVGPPVVVHPPRHRPLPRAVAPDHGGARTIVRPAPGPVHRGLPPRVGMRGDRPVVNPVVPAPVAPAPAPVVRRPLPGTARPAPAPPAVGIRSGRAFGGAIGRVTAPAGGRAAWVGAPAARPRPQAHPGPAAAVGRGPTRRPLPR